MSETELKLQVALEDMPRAPSVLAGNERDQSSETLEIGRASCRERV